VIYLDHNATTPVRPEVLAAMLPWLSGEFGNPSSQHAAGRRARAAVEAAREQVAALIGADAEAIRFTSGGTEADNWALRGRCRLVTSSVEHPAVLRVVEARRDAGEEAAFVPVDGEGRLDPDEVLAEVRRLHPGLVSLILANNETGTLQPLEAVGAALMDLGTPFHIDAVQAVGKVPVDVDELHAGLLSLSAHKINGPKGVGALYVRPGTDVRPWQVGGEHEFGLRAGTENVAGIVGFGEAARLRHEEGEQEVQRVAGLRDRLQAGLLAAIPDIVVNGSGEHRLPNTTNLSFTGVEAESVLLGLDLEEIAASSGSACTEGTAEPSHVLLAMGREPRVASAAVRFSLGWGNDAEQVERVIEVLPPIVARLRDLSPY
jgi:cysteine desulfurase